MSELTGDWLTISADRGTGDAALTVTVTEVNKGRNQRQVVVIGETEHGATGEATIVQDGENEYVSFDSVSYNIANSGTSVTITGKSNSKKLTFGIATPSTGETDYLNIPSSYTATKGASSQSVSLSPIAAELDPDYGATGEFAFSITLTTKDTSPSKARQCRFYAATFGGPTDYTTINQEGVASTILFDGESSKQYSADKSFTMNIGVTPSGTGWTLEFES